MEMRAVFFCLGVIIASVSGYCPSLEYDLIDDVCIRPLQLWSNDTIINLQPQSQRDCGLDGASLPIIKNAQDNDFFNQVANSIDEIAGWNNYLVLGLVCNPWTHELRWQDGSAVDYTPGLNMGFDCTKYTAVSRTKFGDWKLVSVADTWSYTVFCVTDPKYIN